MTDEDYLKQFNEEKFILELSTGNKEWKRMPEKGMSYLEHQLSFLELIKQTDCDWWQCGLKTFMAVTQLPGFRVMCDHPCRMSGRIEDMVFVQVMHTDANTMRGSRR